ncbi:MAG TPA: formate dehydrogenase accessory protein FdhE [Vicinamibacterales bacterium]|nr:formate dehydrogenase accessory protein FdhE [Vicinamibacterales bacterium]
MPYVAVLGQKPPVLTEIAERRWSAVLAARPDLAPALDLQRRLLALVLELDATLAGGRMPRLSLPPKYLAAKLGRGVPALAGEPIPLPVPAMTPIVLKLCDALAAGGAGDAAAHIRASLASGEMDAGSLVAASLARNQAAIRSGASHRGLAPDLVWLVGELAVSPFVYRLQQTLFGESGDATLRAALDAWDRGYCAACGSWPALAEVVAGHRTLRCSFCSSAWELNRYACIYCGETGEKFVTAAPNEERKDRRVEVCSNCGGYLKTSDLPELSPFPLLSISDIETTDLDIAAMEHGYQRPALREFTKAR